MSVPTTSEKQQKTANLLAAGNLWYQRKSSIALEKMSQVSAQSLEQSKLTNAKLSNINNNIKALASIADEQTREMKKQTALQEQKYAEEEARRIQKENEDRENEFLKDAFFHLKKELTELEESEKSNLEKYFSIMSVSSLMSKYKISTSLTQDLNEKQIISDSLDKIKTIESELLNNFSEQDNKDLNTIFEIMEEDEESQIREFEKQKSEIEGISKDIEDLRTSNNLGEIIKKYQKIVEELK
jgi:hypothetical protein